jgi:hypothetical protein
MRILLLLWLLCSPAKLHGQFLEPDPRSLAIALVRARAELAVADSARSRTRQLFERRLVSRAELEAADIERERAALAVLERWAALTAAPPQLRVVRARKGRGADGGIVVRLRVAALTTAWPEPSELVPVPDDVLARLGASGPRDAFLSVKDEPGASGTAIGVPYEQRLALARDAPERDFEFRLLRDVDALVVTLSSGAKMDERKVWLEADASGAIAIQPLPFSQEADLGAEAAYDLVVERFGGGDAPLRLGVEGLPDAVAHGFTDAETGARIGQLRFASGTHQRRVRLTLSLPHSDAGAVTVDSAYRFRVAAVPASGPAGRAELELVARGVGKVELRAFNLFHESAGGAPLDIAVMVRNAGSRGLEQVRIRADLPSGWSLDAAPPELRELAAGQEQPVRLTIVPPPNAELGDYEARLLLEGSAGRARLAAEPTVLRVRLRARKSSALAIVLSGVLLAAAAGAIAVSRRLARR